MSRSKITVIIPCRNEVKFIAKTVDLVYLSDYDHQLLDVIIADGMSDDGTREILSDLQVKYPALRVLDNTRRITPVAFNLGLTEGKGDYLITVGARHLIAPGYIKTCAAILDKDDSIACAGGISSCIESSRTGIIIANAMSTSFGIGAGNFRASEGSRFVDTVGTPMYRKSVLNKIGYFDEGLVRNQDDELSYRITSNGYKIFQTADTHVQYITRNTFTNLWRQLFQYGYWKVLVNKKHRAITTLRQLVPPLFVLYLAFAMIASLFPLPLSAAIIYLPLLAYIAMAAWSAIKLSTSFTEAGLTCYCFLLMHLSYGCGYLQGILDFILLGKGPSEKNKKLTR